VCGVVALTIIPLAVGSSLAVYLTTVVKAATIGVGDIYSSVTTTTLVFLYFALLAYMVVWRNLESYFDTFPWKEAAGASKKVVGKRTYQIRCPFTGNNNLKNKKISIKIELCWFW